MYFPRHCLAVNDKDDTYGARQTECLAVKVIGIGTLSLPV